MFWLAILFACGDPAPIASTPVDPTVDLKTEEESVTWTVLDGFFAEGDPAVPAPVQGLRVGMPEAEARAILEAARHPQLQVPSDRRVSGITAVSRTLAANEHVALTLLVGNGKLYEFDFALPAKESSYALENAWGRPTGTFQAPEGPPQPTWALGDMHARLIDAGDRRILKFYAPGAEAE